MMKPFLQRINKFIAHKIDTKKNLIMKIKNLLTRLKMIWWMM